MKATLSWQNPFAWQIITFISSCKLYSLSFLTKLGYFCDLFQSLQRQSAGFLPLDPRHPGDIHYRLIPWGLPAASCRWLTLPSSAPGTDCMKKYLGGTETGRYEGGLGKEGEGAVSSFPREPDGTGLHVCIMHQCHLGCLCCWCWPFLLMT